MIFDTDNIKMIIDTMPESTRHRLVIPRHLEKAGKELIMAINSDKFRDIQINNSLPDNVWYILGGIENEETN